MRRSSPRKLLHGRRQCNPAGVLLPQSIAAGPANLTEVFGNRRPVELEIGLGKGTFLLARARARPELNFLGLERAEAYCLYAADRCRRAGLTNVRLLCCDAGSFFHSCLPEQSLWRVHIYFPDPWPKQRHHRRRLIQPRFSYNLCQTLRLGGQLLIVTDHLDYFRQILTSLNGAFCLASIPFPGIAGANGLLVGTNFARKYLAEGRVFYSAAWFRYR